MRTELQIKLIMDPGLDNELFQLVAPPTERYGRQIVVEEATFTEFTRDEFLAVIGRRMDTILMQVRAKAMEHCLKKYDEAHKEKA